MRRRALLGLLLGSAVALALSTRAGEPAPREPEPAASRASAGGATPAPVPADPESASECASRPLRLPAGGPALVGCDEARRIVAQVRAKLAVPVSSPAPADFARQVAGWLDPHGLWSAAPDAPVRSVLSQHAARLLAELEAVPRPGSRCEAAEEVGRVLRDWVLEMRRELSTARSRASKPGRERAFALSRESIFQDDPVTRPARALARDLGARLGSFEAEFGDDVRSVAVALDRFAPDRSAADWARAVLAAALRAYVPAVDPHGQWAPLDEEWSLHAADPALDGEPRLWGGVERTALGLLILDGAMSPLADGDLVLSVGGVVTAGLSVEQADQLAHVEAIAGESKHGVVVLRRGEARPITVSVDLDHPPAGSGASLGVRRVSFGSGEVVVVSIPDVPDELGEDLGRLVADLGDPAPAGILLDLRGNGGGSIDGATRALGIFLPGAPVFPLRRRDGAIELAHAETPAPGEIWQGPVAALVDGYTASAAEMIAGALLAYRRGPVVGTRTFGKGCIQEYFDDLAGVGVLRLTTMVFSLPDGSPLQGVGIRPSLLVDLPPVAERERSLSHSPGPWRGPDVRTPAAVGGPDWPPHAGRIGVTDDPGLRAALRRLGAAPRRSAAAVGARPPRRGGPG